MDSEALHEVRFLLENLAGNLYRRRLLGNAEGAVVDPRQWKVSMKRIQQRLLSEERGVANDLSRTGCL